MNFSQRMFLAMQYALPHHLLSRIVHYAMRWQWRPWKDWVIRTMVRIFNIDVVEVVRPVPDGYRCFNDFFTRELTDGARPIADSDDAIACPSDGAISQLGPIDGEQVLQAKGRHYRLVDLVGGRQDIAARFQDGLFATIYLAPRNYHRVHMPLDGRLVETIYVPGRLFSVAPLTARQIPGLFARNERLVCLFENQRIGHFAVILVGAMLVSGIETVWDGPMTRHAQISTTNYKDKDINLARGEEMGRFNMGSTVILLFGPDTARWGAYAAEQGVRVGQQLGTLNGDASDAEDQQQN